MKDILTEKLKTPSRDLYDLIKSTSEPVKPAGEWNTTDCMFSEG
jgi:hypothetical protein